ncbi:MAG: hypothetical protein JWM10_1274, partial [Myxococcaceae bacterium]|nr:hypothetical protein [Myxococcaceae bacterium]
VESAGEATALRPGDLAVATHLVAIPDAVFPARDWSAPRPWRLPNYSPAQATALLAEAPGVAAALQCDAGGCSALAPPEAIEAIPRAARSRIYAELARFDGNPQADDTFFRPEALGPFSTVPGIPDAVRPLMDALTWSRDGVPAFTDIAVACSRLGGRDECREFMRAMLSRPSASVSVRLDQPGAIERAAEGFVDGERAAVRARLTEARASGQREFPLDALMPPWARGRLETFPAAGEEWTNCFWSVLRFDDRAEGIVGNGEGLDAALARSFVPVTTGARFGDALVLRDDLGRALHAVTWLLGGYVFEKNGFGRMQAWRVVPVGESRSEYPTASRVEVWRARGRE